MIDSRFTIGEMRTLRDLLHVVGDRRIKFAELESQLEERGHVIKSGLSKWLSRIEVTIGGKSAIGLILERSRAGDGSWLTPEGQKICVAFGEILKSLDDRIGQLAANHRQRIRIGLTNSLTANLLPRVMTEDLEFIEFMSNHPALDIKVVEGEPDEIERHVATGWVDFAIGPSVTVSDTEREPFHQLKRVLIFDPAAPTMAKLIRFAKLPALDDDSVKQLQRCLADITLLIPPKRVMPKLEKSFLTWPIGGRWIKLPQASLRRAWAKLGLGAAFIHDENFSVRTSVDDAKLWSIDLSSQIGMTTLCFYFKDDISTLSIPAQKLIQAIRRVFHQA